MARSGEPTRPGPSPALRVSPTLPAVGTGVAAQVGGRDHDRCDRPDGRPAQPQDHEGRPAGEEPDRGDRPRSAPAGEELHGLGRLHRRQHERAAETGGQQGRPVGSPDRDARGPWRARPPTPARCDSAGRCSAACPPGPGRVPRRRSRSTRGAGPPAPRPAGRRRRPRRPAPRGPRTGRSGRPPRAWSSAGPRAPATGDADRRAGADARRGSPRRCRVVHRSAGSEAGPPGRSPRPPRSWRAACWPGDDRRGSRARTSAARDRRSPRATTPARTR